MLRTFSNFIFWAGGKPFVSRPHPNARSRVIEIARRVKQWVEFMRQMWWRVTVVAMLFRTLYGYILQNLFGFCIVDCGTCDGIPHYKFWKGGRFGCMRSTHWKLLAGEPSWIAPLVNNDSRSTYDAMVFRIRSSGRVVGWLYAIDSLKATSGRTILDCSLGVQRLEVYRRWYSALKVLEWW